MQADGTVPAARLDALAGRRVTLRRRLPDRDGRPLYTDAVGELELRDATTVTVHTRRGPVEVSRASVVAVRAVPPPVPRRPSWAAVMMLQELCADAWPALVDERLGGWRLRAADGFTGRANSALALGDPGVPIGAALAAVGDFARRHGVAPRVLVPVGSPTDRAVAAQGWVLAADHEAGPTVSVQVLDLDRIRQPPGGPDVTTDVAVAAAPDAHWWAAVGLPDPTPAQRHVLAGAARPAFALARRDGVPVGALRGALVDDHVHFSRLVAAPAARRSGVGTALTAAVVAWARDRGARWAVLQVATHNDAALAFYRDLGAVEHHRYRYLRPGP